MTFTLRIGSTMSLGAAYAGGHVEIGNHRPRSLAIMLAGNEDVALSLRTALANDDTCNAVVSYCQAGYSG